MSLNGYVGNAADSQRIRRMNEQREKEKAEFEALKAGNRDNGSRLVGFAASNSEYVEHVFKQDTVGLQTKEQFAEKARSEAAGRGKRAETGLSPRTPLTQNAPQRANVEREVEAQRQRAARAQEESEQQALSRKRAAAKVVATARLSFVDPDAEEEAPEEEDEGARDAPAAGKDAKRPRFGALGKNPTVETSFLPDAAREREEREERELLKGAWLEQQARQKAQPLSITYSYWDGSGHRRALVVRTGDTVGTFLRAVRDALAPEFRELKAASADQMLYVKEDLIIPHSLTFHELIVSKARGKSGPLFHFDVHEDVRLQGDARVEKDEAHAGKVLERHWYDKNKHIFPASRWEIYDPQRDYGTYTIHGGD